MIYSFFFLLLLFLYSLLYKYTAQNPLPVTSKQARRITTCVSCTSVIGLDSRVLRGLSILKALPTAVMNLKCEKKYFSSLVLCLVENYKQETTLYQSASQIFIFWSRVVITCRQDMFPILPVSLRLIRGGNFAGLFYQGTEHDFYPYILSPIFSLLYETMCTYGSHSLTVHNTKPYHTI